MNVSPGYDPQKKRIIITVESNLLNKYFPNFSGMVMSDSGVPKNTEVDQSSPTTAIISFPSPLGSPVKKLDEERSAIAIDSRIIEKFNDIINNFIRCAIRRKLRTTEFIPLSGYPVEDLKKDIQEAVKNKRSLCIIKNYDEYLAMENNQKYVFHQYEIEYGTKDYTEAAILLYQGSMEELREMFEGRLELEDWC